MATHHPSATGLRTTALPSGETVPVLGQGTWGMADHPKRRADEIASLRLGINLGMTLIDTADHVRENRGALEIGLTEADLAELDEAFPPPAKPTPLEML